MEMRLCVISGTILATCLGKVLLDLTLLKDTVYELMMSIRITATSLIVITT